MPEVTYASEVITPETARAWLKKYNKHNRPFREWKIRLLQTDIENDNLVENGEVGVTFDWNGHVAGGQHTLAAIERSGKTVRVRVTRNVDPRARDTMNDTLKERMSDRLHSQGIPNAMYAEPMLRKVMVWETVAAEHKGQGGLDMWRNARYSRANLMGEWPKYAGGIVQSLAEVATWYDSFPQVGNRGALQFMHWLLTEKHGMQAAAVARFFDIMAYGSDDNRERMLRTKLVRKFGENHNAEYQVYWMMRMWNMWVHNESPTKFQGPKGGFKDPYPKLRVVRLWISRCYPYRPRVSAGNCVNSWGSPGSRRLRKYTFPSGPTSGGNGEIQNHFRNTTETTTGNCNDGVKRSRNTYDQSPSECTRMYSGGDHPSRRKHAMLIRRVRV